MPTSSLRIDSTPHNAARLPFASEMGVQRFVEKHAKGVLGLEVIASTQRGGGRLFDIDILAADKTGRPVIVECKWDSVGEGAFDQLAKYKAALRSGWARFEECAEARSIRVRKAEPLLVTIGYRYREIPTPHARTTLCLSYAYHGIVFTKEEVQEQKPGRVSVHPAATMSASRHPKVCKKLSIVERLERCARELHKPFLEIDEALSQMEGVTVKYSGKNFVNYHARHGVFAKAVIDSELIRWHVKTLTSPIEMNFASDAGRVRAVLQGALQRAG